MYSHLCQQSLATHAIDKNVNSLDILCQTKQGAQADPPCNSIIDTVQPCYLRVLVRDCQWRLSLLCPAGTFHTFISREFLKIFIAV